MGVSRPGLELSATRIKLSLKKEKYHTRKKSSKMMVSVKLKVTHPQGQHRDSSKLKNSPLGPWRWEGMGAYQILASEHGSLVVAEIGCKPAEFLGPSHKAPML